MSDPLTWHPLYNVGIHEIDLQHKTLFAMCNNLIRLIDKPTHDTELEDLISDFHGYLTYHNAFEEGLMKEHKYPNMASHVLEHRNLVEKVRELLRPHDETYNLDDESKRLFLEAMAEHVSGDDLELGRYLAKHVPEDASYSGV